MSVKCDVCGDEFDTERAMKVHKSQKHPEDRREEVGNKNTGIDGLDSLMSEGIPEGSSVLVEGGPGSGKTIMCLQIAYNAVERGEKALYMSFEEPIHRLVDHMHSFGWDVDQYLDEELRMERYNALDIARSVEALLSEAKRELLIDVKPMLFPEDFDPDVVFIDSLTSIASAFSGEKSRFRIYMEQLFKYLENEEITSYLIREVPSPAHIGSRGGEGQGQAVSFLSDGIIAIYNAIHPSGKRDRGIEIIKMRGENFEKGIHEMYITGESGIEVNSEERVPDEYTLT